MKGKVSCVSWEEGAVVGGQVAMSSLVLRAMILGKASLSTSVG